MLTASSTGFVAPRRCRASRRSSCARRLPPVCRAAEAGGEDPVSAPSSLRRHLSSRALSALSALVILFSPAQSVAFVKPPPEPETASRVAAPPPPLTPEEKQTVGLFQSSRPAVVFITSFSDGVDALTLNPQEIPAGAGSGFFWSADRVVTNYHVVKGARQLKVTLGDGEVVDARVVGARRPPRPRHRSPPRQASTTTRTSLCSPSLLPPRPSSRYPSAPQPRCRWASACTLSATRLAWTIR